MEVMDSNGIELVASSLDFHCTRSVGYVYKLWRRQIVFRDVHGPMQFGIGRSLDVQSQRYHLTNLVAHSVLDQSLEFNQIKYFSKIFC